MQPVLTIRQPWASAIFRAGKNVENRSRPTTYRGQLWIHAGAYFSREEPDRWAAQQELWLPQEPLPRGVILGCVDLVDCLEDADSLWALPDYYHWVLKRPMLLDRPVPATGGLSFVWRRAPQGRLSRARRARASYASVFV